MLGASPNIELAILKNLTLFEEILQTPQTGKFIEMCMASGVDFYQVSACKEIQIGFKLTFTL